MPFELKQTTGILGHYSEAWAIAPQLRVEACGSQWKPVEAMEDIRKQWKTCGTQETGKGSEGVQNGQERSRRSGRGLEGHGKVRKRWEGMER